MKKVPIYDAIGMTLSHDLTQVIPGIFKGRAFKKGHVIRCEDIPLLLDMGKEHIYILETEDMVHEDDAALRLARAAAGLGLILSEPVEGKVNLVSSYPGLLKININALFELNSINQIIFSTLHNNLLVPQNRIVAGTRIIPLLIEQGKINRAEQICQSAYPMVMIKPLKSLKVGIITTGSEIYRGRIQDKFGPIVTSKIEQLGSKVIRQIIVDDDKSMIARAIRSLLDEGAEMVIATGGMSIDADDCTPAGLEAAGGTIITYGVPVLPGSMFMLAYIENIPVLGLPACVIHAPVTVFDLILPRLLSGEHIDRRDLIELGHGGLCSNCQKCFFPDCSFGK